MGWREIGAVKGVLSLLKGAEKQKGLLEISEEEAQRKPLINTTTFTCIPGIGVGCQSVFRGERQTWPSSKQLAWKRRYCFEEDLKIILKDAKMHAKEIII